MNLSQISRDQLRLILRGIGLIEKGCKKGFNVHSSPFFYLNSWAYVPGYVILKSWQIGIKAYFLNFQMLVKSYLAVARLNNISVKEGQAFGNQGYKALFISWCRKEDFINDEYYNDKYFNTSASKTTSALWFLMSTDNYCPCKLENNVFLLKRGKRKSFIGDLSFFILILFKEILKNSFNFVQLIHRFNSNVILAKIVSEKIVEITEKTRINQVWIPYEAQPLQNHIFYSLKRKNPKIVTKGYLHSALPPLMTDLIFRQGAPDILYVHGEGQIEILMRHLRWPKSSITKIKSLRYTKEDKWDMSGYIFLPYDFFNISYYVNKFEFFLKRAKIRSLPHIKVRNHPQAVKSKKHLALVTQLEYLISKYRKKLDSKSRRKVSIFFGATAAILEALEYKIEVFHIVSDATFEAHSSYFWKNINVEMIGENIFKYEILQYGSYIDFGECKNDVLKYLD